MNVHLTDLKNDVLLHVTPFLFLFVSSHLSYAEQTIIVLFVWNLSDPKARCSFYAFIMNNKVLLYLYNLYDVLTS